MPANTAHTNAPITRVAVLAKILRNARVAPHPLAPVAVVARIAVPNALAAEIAVLATIAPNVLVGALPRVAPPHARVIRAGAAVTRPPSVNAARCNKHGLINGRGPSLTLGNQAAKPRSC